MKNTIFRYRYMKQIFEFVKVQNAWYNIYEISMKNNESF